MKLILISLLFASAVGFSQGTRPTSQEELLKQVVSGIGAKDQTGLQQLSITQEEFKKYVWPTIVMKVSGQNTNAEKFFTLYQQSSGVGLTQDLTQLGGKKLEVIKVTPGTLQKKSKDYSLYGAPQVLVRDADGKEQTIQPVGGVLEQGGAVKVTTFYIGAGSK
jgi:hypothetical protein